MCNIREEDEGEDVQYPQGASTAAAVELLLDANIEVPHVEQREEEGGHVEDLRAEPDQSAEAVEDQAAGDGEGPISRSWRVTGGGGASDGCRSGMFFPAPQTS